MKALIQKIKRLLRDRRFRRLWSRTISVVAALVVFVTTYALVLPAITMEREAYCGIPAHQHTDACFEQRLICTIPESPGHRHGDSCYTTHQELVCQMEEHTHDPTACYDEEGTLVCQLPEHTHDQTGCWKDVTELTCTTEESDGHQHSDACYENVLVCGMEVHTHSEECYYNPDEDVEANAVAAMQDGGDGTGAEIPDEGVVFETYGDFAEDADNTLDPNGEGGLPADDGTGIPNDDPILNEEGLPGGEGLPSDEGIEEMAAGQEIEGGGDGLPAGGEGTTNGEDGMPEQGIDGNPDTALDENGNPVTGTQTDIDENGNPVAGTQTELDENGNPIVDPNAAQETSEATQGAVGGELDPAANTYIPNLAPIDFAAALSKRTGIYYYAVQEGESVEDSSSISGWKKIEKNTELGPNDLLRVYLSYTIPAGSLNKTNPTAVYRLPANLRLTDAQVNAINAVENGIAARYIDYNTLTLTDPDNYHRYLGAEAIEGTRKPGEDLSEYLKEHTADGGEAQEFISATVRVENIYGTASGSGEGDGTAILGQNLIFTFSPYTIEKNQHTYDTSGQPTRAGEKVRGWFTLDFNLGQVEWTHREEHYAEITPRNNNAGPARQEVLLETADDQSTVEGQEQEDRQTVEAGQETEEIQKIESGTQSVESVLDYIKWTTGILFRAAGHNAGGTEYEEIRVDLTMIEPVEQHEQMDALEEQNPQDTQSDEITEDIENTEEVVEPEGEQNTESGEQELQEEENGKAEGAVPVGEQGDKQDKTDADTATEKEDKKDIANYPAQIFEDTINVQTQSLASDTRDHHGAEIPSETELTVHVEAPEGAFPEGTVMTLGQVSGSDADHVAEALEGAVDANTRTRGFHAVDISFHNSDGDEIEPLRPIQVSMRSESIRNALEDQNTEAVVMHLQEPAADQTAEAVEQTEIDPAKGTLSVSAPGADPPPADQTNPAEEPHPEETDSAADLGASENGSVHEDAVTEGDESLPNENDTEEPALTQPEMPTVQQDNQPAPVFEGAQNDPQGEVQAGVQTMQVDGQDAEEQEDIRFESDSFSIYAIVYTVDFHWEVNGKKYEYSIPGGGFMSFEKLMEILGVAKNDGWKNENYEATGKYGEEDSSTDTTVQSEPAALSLTIADIEVGEETRRFVAEVETVEFSSPELVWVGKIVNETNVGRIKEERDLTVQYSADLTEDQIAEINRQPVEAGDWAIISLQPFGSRETLTVTMTSGDVFTVTVTDASYDFTLVPATDLDRRTGALINPVNQNAVQGYAHNTYGRIQSAGVNIDTAGGTVSTTNSAETLTEWTFISTGASGYYYIRCPGGYLNMSAYNSDVTITQNPQALRVVTSSNYPNQIRILNSGYTRALNNFNNETAAGYFGYNGSLYSYNRGEWFYVYDLANEVSPHVNIHFVDRTGEPISGVAYTGNNPLIVRNEDGTYMIPYNWNGTTGTVDLKNEFSKSGYTYASTHLAGTRDGTDYYQDGFMIDAKLEERNTGLFFYTDTGYEAGGNGNLKFKSLKAFNLNASFNVPKQSGGGYLDGASGMTQYFAANKNQDIYVILDPVSQGTSGGGGGASMNLGDPVFEKKLERNNDGTYTLSLSVTGGGKNTASDPKANIIFVVDTSSSMTKPDGANSGSTRLTDTKNALKTFGQKLLEANASPRASDTIEITMVTFDGIARDEIVEGGQAAWVTSYSTLENKINGLQTHTGTNWEDAMKEAHRLGKLKMADQPDEMTYIVFFTDGEPSQYTNFNGGDNYRYWYSYFLSREAAKDEARAIVSDGMQLYSVFAFNKTDESYAASGENGNQLLLNLTQYAYNTSNSMDKVRHFQAKNTAELNNAFASILNSINEFIGITDIKVNDSITSLTSVGLTVMNGNNTGFTYTKSGGSYGTAQEPWVTWAEAPSATYDPNGVHWDLGGAQLEEGVTYRASFIVWPSQEAYDWVADLNNGVRTWAQLQAAGLDSHFIAVPDASMPTGTRYEVATNPRSKDDEGHIINNQITYTKTHRETVGSLPSGVVAGTPVVETDPITGTKTTTTYTPDADGHSYTRTVVTEAVTAFGPPDINMDLQDTDFKVEKIWKVDRPIELAYFLYNTTTGEPVAENKNIIFTVKQDTESHTYKDVLLGYKDDSGVFDWYGETTEIDIDGRRYTVGTIWEEPLDIAFGLMLTPAKAAEHRIDLNDTKYIPVYSSIEDASDPNKSPLYYVLEKGHDYWLEEPQLDYRFDFNTDIYHPMLVDSVPRDAKITYIPAAESGAGREIGILKSITPEDQRLSALSGENVLRGELSLKKNVIGLDGQPDNRKMHSFPLEITLENDTGPFYNIPNSPNEQNVPWYGIQIGGTGEILYYHTFKADGSIEYVNEATACIDGHYNNGLKNGYYGNVMDEHDDKTITTVTINIYPTDKWTITNIPGGTTYTVREQSVPGYTFVKAEELDSSPQILVESPSAPVISGTIHYNLTTDVEFTNRRVAAEDITIELIKVDVNKLNDENPPTLPHASFTVEKYTNSSYRQLDETWGTQGKKTISDTPGNGLFSFTGLVEGYYKIVETEFPDGYIQVDRNPLFEVRINAATNTMEVVLLEKVQVEGEGGETQEVIRDVVNNNDGVVKIENARITVGNTPGVALPNTGGPGTLRIYLTGLLLTALAGLCLWARREYGSIQQE